MKKSLFQLCIFVGSLVYTQVVYSGDVQGSGGEVTSLACRCGEKISALEQQIATLVTLLNAQAGQRKQEIADLKIFLLEREEAQFEHYEETITANVATVFKIVAANGKPVKPALQMIRTGNTCVPFERSHSTPLTDKERLAEGRRFSHLRSQDLEGACYLSGFLGSLETVNSL